MRLDHLGIELYFKNLQRNSFLKYANIFSCLLQKSTLKRSELPINHTVTYAGVQILAMRANNPFKDNSEVHIFTEIQVTCKCSHTLSLTTHTLSSQHLFMAKPTSALFLSYCLYMLVSSDLYNSF